MDKKLTAFQAEMDIIANNSFDSLMKKRKGLIEYLSEKGIEEGIIRVIYNAGFVKGIGYGYDKVMEQFIKKPIK